MSRCVHEIMESKCLFFFKAKRINVVVKMQSIILKMQMKQENSDMLNSLYLSSLKSKFLKIIKLYSLIYVSPPLLFSTICDM